LARSSTSFKPGNRAGFKPGNKLALRHGAESLAVVKERLPAKVAELAVLIPFLQDCDLEAVKSYASFCVQEDLIQEYLKRQGGSLITSRGAPRRVWVLWTKIQHGKREWAKILGIGPVPRAQMAQAMAGAAVGSMEVRAAQERLRAKQASPSAA
jgi:hypothetical protein